MATKIELDSNKRNAKNANDGDYVFVVEAVDAKGATIKNVDNDTVAIEGNAADYIVKATGAGVIVTKNLEGLSGAELKAAKQFKLTITLQKENAKKGVDAGVVTLAFADGAIDLTRDGKNIVTGEGVVVTKKAKEAGALDIEIADETFGSVTAEEPTEPQPGQSFTLTADKTSYTGTANNDTFNSDVLTLTNDTVINGGNGVDTLNATLIGDVAPTLNSVEKVFVEALTDVSVDASSFTGVQELWTRDSVGDLTVNGLTSSATVIGIENTDQDVTVNYATSAIQGNTTVTVALNGAAGGTVTLGADSNSTTQEVNNVVLNSIGAVANTLAAVVLNDQNTDESQTLTVRGTQSLEITAALADNINVINAGNMAGDLTLEAVGDTDGLLFNGATMTGAANITVATGAATDGAVIRTGSGDDTITFEQLGDAKLVNGGAGNDTLIATVATANQAPVIQNVETLNLTFDNAGSLDAAAIAGATQVNVEAVTNGGAVVISNMNTSIANVALETGPVGDVELGYRNTVTGNLTLTTGAEGSVTGDSLTVNNVGTLAIVNADNTLITGNLTLDNAKTTSVSLVNNGIAGETATVGDITNGADGALTTVSVEAAGAGAATIGDVDADKLASLTVSATAGNATAGDITTEAALTVSLAAAGATVATATTATVGDVDTTEADLTLNAVATGAGILTAGTLDGDNVTVTATSATGDVDVGDVTAAAAAALTLTSTEGALTVDNVEGETITVTATTAGAVFVGTLGAGAVDTDSVTLSLTGVGITAGAVTADAATVTLTSTDGDVDLGALDVENAAVVTVNAGDADESGNNTVTLGAVSAESVTLSITSANAVTVTTGITAEAAINTGRVIDITLAGEGDVDLGALTVSNVTGNTTSVDASALEGDLTVTLSAAQDTVKLGTGADTVTITALVDSLLGSSDLISGFSVANDALEVAGITIDNTDTGTEVRNLGSLTALTAEAIQTAIDAWDVANAADTFDAGEVGFFTFDGKSYLLVNDGNAAFSATTDAVIEVTGITFGLGESLYFA